ncbi:hypothetical protein TRSC58_07673 [Trypanosoma rangeli SC58]|uniref:Uncharacterized protein n=1 Tax=Trypanosoma rangeli SC58 TaxID=429131 RepID=A0A061IRI4_TRYRA|nr:hypothetical protein TRSC58_07673 [Trypanosoma rangeli SC58]
MISCEIERKISGVGGVGGGKVLLMGCCFLSSLGRVKKKEADKKTKQEGTALDAGCVPTTQPSLFFYFLLPIFPFYAS